MELKNKTILVTGSSIGIGKQLIIDFAKNGYNVIIHYNTNKDKAIELEKLINDSYDVKTLVLKCDITSEEEIKNMKEKIIDEFGYIDILINNAAYAQDNYFYDKTKEEFMKVLEVNVCGTFLVTKYLNDIVKEFIINISSTDSITTYNDISMDYCASKAGVNSLTKTFSMALKDKKVICVMPRWVNTESIKNADPDYIKSELLRTNQERLLEPSEVSNKIIELINRKNIESGSIWEV